jgi:hypothetical protein
MEKHLMIQFGSDSGSRLRGTRTLPLSKGRRLLHSAILAGALVALLQACSLLPFRVEGERPFLGVEGPQRKTVSGKEPPNRLVAVDGTICIVSKERYESVKPEDKVWCAWRARGE